MNLKDCRDYYYFYSGKTSDIVRQLGFAGIAIIWVFKSENQGKLVVPPELIYPGILIVVGLALDLLHYDVATALWGIFNRIKERSGTKEQTEFKAPRAINWPALTLFWSKAIIIAVAYVELLLFLGNKWAQHIAV